MFRANYSAQTTGSGNGDIISSDIISSDIASREKYFNPLRGPDLRKLSALERLEGRTWQVSEIHGMHHEIIRLLLLGMKNVDIAARIGCGEQQVSNIRNSQVIQDRLSLMQASRDIKAIDISRDIMETAPEALKVLRQIVKGEKVCDQTPTIGLISRTAESLLDRAGFGAVKRVATQNEHVFYSSDEIEELKKRAKANGDIVDASFETADR